MHAGFGLYCAWIVLSSILLVAYDYTLRILATCPCIQPGGALHGVCFCCRDCFKDAGKQGLYVVSVGSFGFLVAGVVLFGNNAADPAVSVRIPLKP